MAEALTTQEQLVGVCLPTFFLPPLYCRNHNPRAHMAPSASSPSVALSLYLVMAVRPQSHTVLVNRSGPFAPS